MNMIIPIQCKNLTSRVGTAHVKEFITTVNMIQCENKLGIIISSSGFSQPCYSLIGDNILLLTDKDNIIDIIKSYQLSQREIKNTSEKISEIRFISLLEINIQLLHILYLILILCIISVIFNYIE
jgi:hypothetical protein